MVFKNGIFALKPSQRKALKVLIPKRIFQRLPIALALVRLGGNSEDLLYNEFI